MSNSTPWFIFVDEYKVFANECDNEEFEKVVAQFIKEHEMDEKQKVRFLDNVDKFHASGRRNI